MTGPAASAASALTDGTGISRLTSSKVVKDLVADFLLTASAALVAVNIVSVDGAAANPVVVATALIGAVVRVGYRAALKWTAS